MNIKINRSVNIGSEHLGSVRVRQKIMRQIKMDFDRVEKEVLSEHSDKMDKNTSLFIKGYPCYHDSLRYFADFMIHARELQNSLLANLNKIVLSTGKQIPGKFKPFLKKLMIGEFDYLGLHVLNLLKNNFTFFFNIKKLRDVVKTNISEPRVMLVNKELRVNMRVPISDSEMELIEYLDMLNKEKARVKKDYSATIVIGAYMADVLDFFDSIFDLFKKDKMNKRNKRR